MVLFKNNNSLFEAIHGQKYYTLCRRFNGRVLTDAVTLRQIPTAKEAEIILSMLHFPNAKLVSWDGMERIDFREE